MTMWLGSKTRMYVQLLSGGGSVLFPLSVHALRSRFGGSPPPPTGAHRFQVLSMARVPMNQQFETDDIIQQTILRCCVCSRAIPVQEVRTCRNPTCLQTLCSTWCGILHNRSICPSADEIEARSNTIRRQTRYKLDGGNFWQARGQNKTAGRGHDLIQRRHHRSRSGVRGDTNMHDMATHAHIPTTCSNPVIQRGQP